MPHILFDPPSSNNGRKQRGGMTTLTPALRKRYMSYLHALTDRSSHEPTRPIVRRMLGIIFQTAIDYLETLMDHQQYRPYLEQIQVSAMEAIDGDEHDELLVLNLVAFQVAVLFTKYEMDHPAIILRKTIAKNYPRRSNKEIVEEYNEELQRAMRPNPVYEGILNQPDWTSFPSFLRYLHTWDGYQDEYVFDDYDYSTLLHITMKSPDYLIPMIGFVTLAELNTALMNRVYFLGLSYETDYVDGNINTPYEFYSHDVTHYKTYNMDCGQFPVLMDHVRAFFTFFQSKSMSATERYSIHFILFLMFHERECLLFKASPYYYNHEEENRNRNVNMIHRPSNLPNEPSVDAITAQSIMSVIKEQNLIEERLVDQTDLGTAIPPSYREIDPLDEPFAMRFKRPIRLKSDRVEQYIRLSAQRFEQLWKEFHEATVIIKGGRRRHRRQTHRRRLLQKKRSTKKAPHRV